MLLVKLTPKGSKRAPCLFLVSDELALRRLLRKEWRIRCRVSVMECVPIYSGRALAVEGLWKIEAEPAATFSGNTVDI